MQPSIRTASATPTPAWSKAPPSQPTFNCAADEELKGKLLRRQQASEGEGNKHCFVRPGKDELLIAAATAEAAADDKAEAEATAAEEGEEDKEEEEEEHEEQEEHEQRAGRQGADGLDWPCEAGSRPSSSISATTGPATGSSSDASFFGSGATGGDHLHVPQQASAGSQPVSTLPSPRDDSKQRSDDAVQEGAADEDFEGCLDEWLLELVNHLPRERVIALEQYIRSLEKEKMTATASLKKARQSNLELQQERRHGRCSLGMWLLALLAVPLLFLLASPYLNALELPSPTLASLAARSEEALNGALSGGVVGLCEALTSSPLGDLRNAPPSIASLVADSEYGSCPQMEEVTRLKSEHGMMKQQLDRLHMDIDDAISKGQDMVCWKV
mmetsp:Transcript_25792/g.54758  ORF Transcript_25792/g.54758 Transcript_25792/m.54758 type:complete len:386 (-) Transcript_25792:57-1214(-)